MHAGDVRDTQGAIHPPLYGHSTFAFDSTADLLDVVEAAPRATNTTATAVAEFLTDHPRVTKVNHPSLATGDQAAIIKT